MGEAKRRKLAGTYPDTTAKRFDLMKAAMSLAATAGKAPKVSTPGEPLSERVVKLCAEINPDAKPIFLEYTDVGEGYPGGYCHINVKHRVRKLGGKKVGGWMIWETTTFAEAEFHSVWQTPDGDLVDITPRIDGEERILFLPDPKTKFTPTAKGDLTPANRTTVAGCPYVVGGVPMEGPFHQIDYNAEGLAKFSAWGIDPPTNADDPE